MKKQNQLLIARGIFFFIVFVSLGVIVVTEKAGGILIPKAEEKMNEYIENNLANIKEEIKLNKITYENTKYTMKVTSKDNNNHFFYITYSNKKITDTYKKDYLQGKNLLEYIKKKLEKQINEKTNISSIVSINSTLDKYTNAVKERIIKEDNLLELKFYTIKKELTIEDWNEKTISKEITNLINKFYSNNITPKTYTITITNKEDITESIEISNLTEEFIKNSSKDEIIKDIIKDNNSKLLKENKIKYKYLN